MLRLGGIHGEKELGMEQLGNTVEKGLYLQPCAKILLALAARREKQYPLAQKMLLELSQEFAESPLYAAEYTKAMGQPSPSQGHTSACLLTCRPADGRLSITPSA